mgnify:CR=1 FL=1
MAPTFSIVGALSRQPWGGDGGSGGVKADYEKLGVPSEDEADMLDLSFNLTPTSRLGCQIRVSEALSGLRVHIPSDF